LQRENYNHPSSEGTFLIPTLNQRQFIGGFRLSHHRIVCTDPKVRRRAGNVGIRDVRITSDD